MSMLGFSLSIFQLQYTLYTQHKVFFVLKTRMAFIFQFCLNRCNLYRTSFYKTTVYVGPFYGYNDSCWSAKFDKLEHCTTDHNLKVTTRKHHE